jgi:hypothetical protein
MSEIKKQMGDCYKTAFNAVVNEIPKIIDDIADWKGKEPILVHGYVTPFKGPCKNKEIKHAWVERTGDDLVYDYCNEGKAQFDRAAYYELYKVRSPIKFTIQEAKEMRKLTGGLDFWGK